MLDADYVQAHLSAAWRIMATAKGDALVRMDISAEGFWRSFWSILLALPPMLLSWVAAAPDFLDGSSLSATVLRLGLADLAAWLLPIAGLALIGTRIGMGRSFAAYVIATNWGSAILVWLAVPPALVRLLSPGDPDPSGFLSLTIFLVSLALGWRITHGSIGRDAMYSTTIFIGMAVTSVLVLVAMHSLLGLSAQP
ncbi:MAG: transporter [Phyllobacteriaceae bacterium]|nr:transporter [Phyllobacteriaceae bacterium]MBA92663.1 transporter [Phyllobacteriaceae bacterium]